MPENVYRVPTIYTGWSKNSKPAIFITTEAYQILTNSNLHSLAQWAHSVVNSNCFFKHTIIFENVITLCCRFQHSKTNNIILQGKMYVKIWSRFWCSGILIYNFNANLSENVSVT